MHKIPFDTNIYDYLRNNIHGEIFMIFLWSNDFLESPACLIEMGAAWVTQSNCSNIFTPDFDFKNPKFNQCAADIRKMGIVLNGDAYCKTGMIVLNNKIMPLFGLSMDEVQFIKKILRKQKRGLTAHGRRALAGEKRCQAPFFTFFTNFPKI